MDKDILRIVIVAVGILIMLGIVVWAFIKDKKNRRKINLYEDSLDSIDESLIINTNDDFDIIPIGSAQDDEQLTETTRFDPQFNEPVGLDEVTPQPIPDIIQFSIVAVADQGFNGKELVESFNKQGLVYGSMQIFERLENNLVNFGVASMVEPGVFPDKDLESFYCPGIVFFMQPKELPNAAEVFEDFVATIDAIAEQLNGVKWDHQRQPLNQMTIQQIRASL